MANVFDKLEKAAKNIDSKVEEVRKGKQEIDSQIEANNKIIKDATRDMLAAKSSGNVKEVVRLQKVINGAKEENEVLEDYGDTYESTMYTEELHRELVKGVHEAQAEVDKELATKVKPLFEQIMNLYEKYHGATAKADESIQGANLFIGTSAQNSFYWFGSYDEHAMWLCNHIKEQKGYEKLMNNQQ